MKYASDFLLALLRGKAWEQNHGENATDFHGLRSHLRRWNYGTADSTMLRHVVLVLATQYLNQKGKWTDGVARQCQLLSSEFRYYWNAHQPFGRRYPLAVTVGNCLHEGEDLYGVDAAAVDLCLRHGSNPTIPVKFHVWLTAPDGWVLDLAILANLARLARVTYDPAKPVVWWHEQHAPGTLAYCPILVKDDFLRFLTVPDDRADHPDVKRGIAVTQSLVTQPPPGGQLPGQP